MSTATIESDTGTIATDTGTTVATEDTETGTEPSKVVRLFKKFFNKENLKILVSFLAIFAVLYIILGIYFKMSSNEGQDSLITATNIITVTGSMVFLFKKYYDLSENEHNNLMKTTYVRTKESILDIETLFTFVVALGFVTGLTKILHLPTSDGRSSFALDILQFILWCALLANILAVVFTDVLNIPVVTIFEDTINKFLYNDVSISVEVDVDVPDVQTTDATSGEPVPSGEPIPTEEVFNVSNNLYTYEEAPHVCSALGARLASYDEIETAYNSGGEWCNYGWSENQMAYFPTQKDTWKKLQSNNKMKNSCGRPGVNGGFMSNPKIKYGVNCFGLKPDASKLDTERMKTSKLTPRTKGDVITERKIAFWKENADKMLNLNPHNKSDWSVYQ